MSYTYRLPGIAQAGKTRADELSSIAKRRKHVQMSSPNLSPNPNLYSSSRDK